MKKLLMISITALLLASTQQTQGALYNPPSYHLGLRKGVSFTYSHLTHAAFIFATQMHPGMEDEPRWRERMAVVAGMLVGCSTSPLIRELFLPNHPFLGALTFTTLLATGAIQSYKLANRLQPFYPARELVIEEAQVPVAAVQEPAMQEFEAALFRDPVEEEEGHFVALQIAAQREQPVPEAVAQRRERFAAAALAAQQAHAARQPQAQEPALQEEQENNPLENEAIEQRRERLAAAALARQVGSN